MYNVFVNGSNATCHYSAFYSTDAVRGCLHEAAPFYGEIPASCQLQVDENTVAYIGRYESRNHTGCRFSLDKFED